MPRFFLLALIVFSSAGALLYVILSGRLAATPPNVVLIIVDDLNTEVGFMGDTLAVTPNLDALAESSVVFDAAFAQAPLCNPSRTSFLTGLSPSTTGVYGLAPNFWDLPEYEDHVTLPMFFNQHGYRTGAVGKIFQTHTHRESFDYIKHSWFGAMGPYPRTPIVKETADVFSRYVDWGPYLEEEQTADYQVASAAIGFLRNTVARHEDVPFMLAVGFFRPHAPLYAPQKLFDLHASTADYVPRDTMDLAQVPSFGKKLVSYQERQKLTNFLAEDGRAASFLKSYRASVSLIDRQIGRVLEHLDKQGLTDNTIVVVLSDHGVHNGQGGLWFKRTLWQASNHVPLMLRIPGYSAQRIAEPVGLVDLYPTLASVAGLRPPKNLDGMNMLPWLRADNIPATSIPVSALRPPVLTVHSPGSFALRDRRWRYIQYADGSEELYDSVADPEEATNLALKDQPADEITTALAQFRSAGPATFANFAPGTSGLQSEAYPGM